MNYGRHLTKARRRPLSRGKACFNCKLRKIKCDANHPVCGPCERVPHKERCQFPDHLARKEDVENTVYNLQFQLNCMQDPFGYECPANSMLHQDPSSDSRCFGGRPCPTSVDHTLFEFQEPPLAVIELLLEYFLPHAAQFGFFLHPERFRSATLLPLPLGDKRRPSPALLYVAYLWGAHLAQLPDEPIFLQCAQRCITAEISDAHPIHALHTLQAHVLLGTYFFRTQNLTQAGFYADGAAGLALGYGLHKLRSARAAVPVLLDVFGALPADPVAEGECIRGFWAATLLQSSLHLVVNPCGGAGGILGELGADIDAPWPLEIADYEAGVLPPDYVGQESVRHLFIDDLFPPSPTCMLQAKAAVLLHHVSQRRYSESDALQSDTPGSLPASQYTWLDHRVKQFRDSLPAIDPLHTHDNRTLVLTHALAAAAALTLSQRCPAAHKQCVAATRAILASLGGGTGPAHPIAAALCARACGVLMDELRAVRAFRAAWAAGLCIPLSPPSAAGADVREGIAVLAAYASDSAFGAYQLEVLMQWCDKGMEYPQYY
ncbi:hypothetical protein DFH09DRAFT_1363891 [Mycena vulgaris]|nr:hypothetical protein DFH09DRAFT_1363891 [Mycena vulgaris]